MTIFELYDISLENKVLDFKNSRKEIYKIINTNNATLVEFLNGWNNSRDITNLLLPDINDVLSGVAALRENGSETISIDIEPDIVTFYNPNVGTNYPKIPTNDFLEIVIAWRNFLLQPPLNGTSVK